MTVKRRLYLRFRVSKFLICVNVIIRILTDTYVRQTNTSNSDLTFRSVMPTGYQIDFPSETYFLTFQVVNWVDIFSRKIYRDIVLDSFTFCREQKGLQLWAYVLMTNHVHCILRAKQGNLPDIIHDFKRFTAANIIKTISQVPESRRDWMLKRFEFAAKYNSRNSHYQFWTHDNHAEHIITQPFFLQKLNYIHQNPVRAGWVARPEDWLYSSMRNYAGLQSLIEIDVSDF